MQYCLDNGRGWPAARECLKRMKLFSLVLQSRGRHDCPLSKPGIENLLFKCEQIKHECWHAVYKWKTGHRFLLAFARCYLLGCGDLHVWGLCGGFGHKMVEGEFWNFSLKLFKKKSVSACLKNAIAVYWKLPRCYWHHQTKVQIHFVFVEFTTKAPQTKALPMIADNFSLRKNFSDKLFFFLATRAV